MMQRLCPTLAAGLVLFALQPSSGFAQGPLTITIVATSAELDEVAPILARMNGKLARDKAFSDQAVRLARAGRHDEVAELVAKAAGVSRSQVQAGVGGTDDDASAGDGLFRQASVRTMPKRELRRTPWSLSYRGEWIDWCIGSSGACKAR